MNLIDISYHLIEKISIFTDERTNLVENLVRKISKMAGFGLILAMILTPQSYDFDIIAHAGAPLGVKWLCKISLKSHGVRTIWNFHWKVGRKKKSRLHK